METMDSKTIMELDEKYVLPTYGRNPVALVRGKGLRAWDAEGKEYLDFTSGIGVNGLGYCPDGWVEAVSRQAATLQHTSNLYYTRPCAQLAQKLCQRTGLDKVFFANSGAEANEGLIKAARKYSADKYGEGRSTVVTLVNSFHGRTLATLTATGQEVFHHYFGPFNDGFVYVPANDLEALKKACEEHPVCALLMEMVQGEGGVTALEEGFVKEAAAYCAEKDILVLADEVQTGIGRTGTFLACEQYGLVPDGISLAKCLGGGLPLGAVVLGEKMAKGMGKGTHGSTFGGNPVACAGANVVVDAISEEFLAQVRRKAEILRAKLSALPHVKQVSGLGLMIGLELEEGIQAADVLAKCQEKGLLVLTAKTRLRLLPPLILTEAEIDEAAGILEDVLKSF